MNIHTDRHTDGRTEYQTNGRTEDKTTSTMIYNHKTHRQTSRSNGLINKRTSKHADMPTCMHNADADISMCPQHWHTCIEVGSQTCRKYSHFSLQNEQSDILRNTYPLHILLEFDLGILRKYSDCIKKEDK